MNSAICIIRQILFCLLIGMAPVIGGLSVVSFSVTEASAAVVSSFDVRGNKRIEDGTLVSYLTIKPGQNFGQDDIDDSVKALFATGLFRDVTIYRSGRSLVVEVVENQTINKVFFEGNTRLKDPILASNVQTRDRGIFSEATVSSDVEIIKLAYSRVGRDDAKVTYEIVPLENERVNVIFRINEGDKTKIRSISFIGNDSVNDARLKDMIATKETNFLSFLGTSDIYDPNRLNADQEIIRRYYYNRGYADFQIVSASADLDEAANEYDVTVTVEEGPRYSFGDVTIESTIAGINADDLYPLLDTVSGKFYSAKRVEDSILKLTEYAASAGFPFAEVTPRGDRDFESNTINVAYLIDEGPKVFIEDIKILGNDRTRDYVIRREFDISEGDAFNQVLIQKAKRRLERLNFFEKVDITSRPGSSADRVIVVVRLLEKSTGEFSIGGGYSSSDGPIAELSFSEKNFLGRGQFISFKAATGSNDTEYGFSFREPYFLGTRISLGLGIEASESQEQDNRLYSIDSVSGNVTFGIPLTEKLSSSVFYNFNQSDLSIAADVLDTAATIDRNKCGATDSSACGVGEEDGIQGNYHDELSAALAPFEGSYLKSGIGYGFTYVDFDNVKDPRNGWRAQFSQTFYGAGGDANYIQTEASALAYVELSEEFDFVGFLRARGGMINGIGDEYRTQDNFFNNSKSVRGFQSRGLGPRDPITDDALGGQAYYNATAEVQFPMPLLPNSFGFRGAFFAEAGTVLSLDQDSIDRVKASNPGLTNSQLDQLDSNSVRASVGASVIWSSPFGPLRFDYALPVAQEEYDNIREFSFGISSKF